MLSHLVCGKSFYTRKEFEAKLKVINQCLSQAVLMLLFCPFSYHWKNIREEIDNQSMSILTS